MSRTLSPSFLQIYDVFAEREMPTLKDSTNFVVSINPSGVVMWYISAPADQDENTHIGGKLRGPAFHRHANGISPIVL